MFRYIFLCFIVCSFTIVSRASETTTPQTMETIDADRIEKSLAKLNITAQNKIQDLVAETDKLNDIDTVYVSSFMNQEIDIFKLPVVETVTKFFVRNFFFQFFFNLNFLSF